MPRQGPDTSRDFFIVERFKSGFTYQQIGDEIGVSRERIRQILARYNLTGADGGNKLRIKIAKEFRENTQNTVFINYWGHDKKAHKEAGTRARLLFGSQRNNARQNGIIWNLNFAEWLSIWRNSGHWNERGLTKSQYVLGRINKSGGFTLDNVHIVTLEQNSSSTQSQRIVNAMESGERK